MHLALTIVILFTAIKWSDWKNWQNYHTTVIFVALGNLLYNFLYHDHYLWFLTNDILPNATSVELIYTVIVFPCTALLFLSNYPGKTRNQIFYTIKYIFIYIVIEWVFYKFGRITYNYGWNIWWSLAWDFMMFPMWILHHKKPLLAYVATILVVVSVLLLFPVNFK